ncbi:MAG: hypothetical protein HRT53_14425 [Colwellia sp.]|nr:hypothetical protein [Colwellia sp.]
MNIKKTILSVLSAAVFAFSASAIEPPSFPSGPVIKPAPGSECPSYWLIPGYIYEWHIDAYGCRYPVFVSKG